MSSGFYIHGLSELMKGNIDLVGADISVALIDASLYAVNLSSDQTLDDIDSDAIIAEEELTGKTVDGTTFNASDTTLESVETGHAVDVVVIFLDAESNEESTLIAYFESDDLPIDTDGDDVILNWNASGIFKL